MVGGEDFKDPNIKGSGIKVPASSPFRPTIRATLGSKRANFLSQSKRKKRVDMALHQYN